MQRVRGCSRIYYSHHASLTGKRIGIKPQYLAYSAYRRTHGDVRLAHAEGSPRRPPNHEEPGGAPTSRGVAHETLPRLRQHRALMRQDTRGVRAYVAAEA